VYFERELVENDELALQNEKKRMLMNKSWQHSGKLKLKQHTSR
jgi:hypothetical protein